MAAAQAQQQGNANIIPLMHSLAHFMPQMAVPGAAHSMPPPAPAGLMPPQASSTAPQAATMPPGFPSFLLASSAAGGQPLPWPLVSQPAGGAFQVAPPLASLPQPQPAAPGAAPAQLQPAAAAPAPGPEAGQPAEAQASAPQASQPSELAVGGALSALLQGNAEAPSQAPVQQPVQPSSLPPPVTGAGGL